MMTGVMLPLDLSTDHEWESIKEYVEGIEPDGRVISRESTIEYRLV
jgi:hypothetical protein